jgi:mono/diheme cytochrome c family protein
MRDMGSSALRAAAVLAALAALASCKLSVAGQPATAQDFAEIERGRYLTAVADCTACHTDPADGKPFAGGRPVPTPFGTVLAANITPDEQTGIGSWTLEQFDAAVRQGRRADGKRLYPAMPYPYYTKMSRSDVEAIRAYLLTLAPVHKQVDTNQLPFPFSIRWGMRLWDALYFKAEPFEADPSKPEDWNRGAYLVQGPGHCAACHTPKSWLGADHKDQALQGYSLQGWFAPNITNDPGQGLGNWSSADLVAYLKTGHNRFAGASGPMAEEVVHSSSRMTDSDVSAIATYLESKPGGSTAAAKPLPATNAVMTSGAAIYEDLCSACHRRDGSGVPYLIPDLSHSASVQAREATSMLHVVLEGAQTAATADEPTGPSMPAFGWQLNDAQVAAVTTYLRNSWGHGAAATTAGDVRKARENLQAATAGGQRDDGAALARDAAE